MCNFNSLQLLGLFMFHQAVCQVSELSGPLEDRTFFVQEGRMGLQYLYQFTFQAPVESLKLTGETDGVIEIRQKAVLVLTGPLDWEQKKVHRLQVEGVNANGQTVKGPYQVTINVEDVNDNPPVFDQKVYYGVVRQHSRPGKPFMYVKATDQDDPTTPHAQLSYSIIQHFPNPHNKMLFQINNVTGAISTSPAGAAYLDPAAVNAFILVVGVNDMGGQSVNAFASTVDVNITVKENLWTSPPLVKIKENSTAKHPMMITQVQWNDPGARYEILPKVQPPAKLPFMVAQNGTIYVTEPLDREEQDEYSFLVAVKDEEGDIPLSYPVTVRVVVEDINDNPPVCEYALTTFEVQENEVVGNLIGTLHATDRDQKDTLNTYLQYQIVDQDPIVPLPIMFRIESVTGTVHLFNSLLKRQIVSNYSLKVEVADPAFRTICNVQINVIDINDQIPIFEKGDYGTLILPEDKPKGTVILEIQATDADEPFTGSSQIVYNIVKGDPNNDFLIETDPKTNKGYIKINNVLDFETTPVYNLTIHAMNPEPLVAGVQYNSSSVAYLKIYVTDVDEAPVFRKLIHIVDIYENATVNSLVVTATAFDPEGDQIRYMLKHNNQNWLRIDHLNGTIFTAAPLDREVQNPYTVQIVATEQTKAARSSTADLLLNLKDVNDNHPRLSKDFVFFCHPLQGNERAKLEVFDPDIVYTHIPRFTYLLRGGSSITDNWNVSKPDGKYAYISPKTTSLEEKLYEIPIEINDNGKPPMSGVVTLQVKVCTCTEDRICFMEPDHHDSYPTVGMAIGILTAVLLVIGIILGIVFYNLKRKKENEQKAAPENATNPTELQTLT